MKARGVKKLSLCILLMSFCACRLVTELMHMEPPRVLSCVPGSALPAPGSLEEVQIEFSQTMDKTRTEEAFQLLEDNEAMAGSFAWKGALLGFRPFAGFSENRTYLMSVSVAAEDSYGNSLAEPFSFRFFTGAEQIPPEILGHSPAEAEEIADLRRPVHLIFSESIDPGSLYRGFSITPPLAGSWNWNADASEATYTPLESYLPGEEYRVEIDTSLADTSGNQAAESHVFRFSAQPALQQEILSFSTGDGRMSLQSSDQLLINQGIEKDDCFTFQLIASVDVSQVDNFIAVVPAVPCYTVWNDDFTGGSLCFSEPLQYEGIYELRMIEKVYRLQVSGAASLPPVVRRVTFANDTAAPLFQELALNQNISVTDSSSACFDFYIEHAAGYAIDLGSFLGALSVRSEDCLTITEISVVRNPSPPEHPASDPSAEENVDVLRVYCRLEDSANPPGVITLELDEELQDTNRNHLQQRFLLTVNKL